MSDFDDHNEQSNEVAIPDGMKKQRACIRCHLIRTENQFKKEGCLNCLSFKSQNESFFDYTSANFEGLISIINPDVSWVARHLNIGKYVAGTYCLKIRDEIGSQFYSELKKNDLSFANNFE